MITTESNISSTRPHQSEPDLIFQYIRKASVLRHLSYCRSRLRIAAAAECLPEIVPIVTHFGFHSLQQWKKEMALHNQILQRGRGMDIGISNTIPAKKFMTSSLDAFLLRMHADKLADVLCSFVTFAKRVEEKIQTDKCAHEWTLNDHILIHRRHWRSLSCSVMNLVKLLCFKTVQMRTRNEDCSSILPSYPDHQKLWDAARRAALIYSCHGAPNITFRALASAPSSAELDGIVRAPPSGLHSLSPRGKPGAKRPRIS
jgi:hypothetical protein